jgi:DNA-binding phage protein
MTSERIGSSLASLFDELGERDDLDLVTRKKVIADQLRSSMREQGVTHTALAEKMETSRTVVHRLLDPTDTSVTLRTIDRASRALGLEMTVSFRPHEPQRPPRSTRSVASKRVASRSVRKKKPG